MMQKLLSILFSMRLTAVLFLTIGIASGVATFVENDFGTQSAKALIYNATWFEIVIALFGLNLIGNIVRFKMYRKEKLPLLIFHISLIFVIFGAALTRYAGYEGMMHIREAESSNVITSSDTYIQAKIIQDGKSVTMTDKVLLSTVSDNDFSYRIPTPKGDVTIDYAGFHQNAAEIVKETPDGKPYLNLVLSTGGAPEKLDLFYGERIDMGRFAIGFGDKSLDPANALVIDVAQDGSLTAKSPLPISWLAMSDRSTGTLEANKPATIAPRHLYTLGGLNLVIKEYLPKAAKELVSVKEKTGISALETKVTFNGESKPLTVFGSSNMLGEEQRVTLGDTTVELSYGSINIPLPFRVKLDAFVLDRYPGSMSPSSYESHVTVIDEANKVTMPYHIYMNHILVYEGYRFYQSSYDQDELGTILSVAKDPGMMPTYIGYFLMALGLVWVLFDKHGRFRRLARSVSSATAAFAAVVVLAGAASDLHAEQGIIDAGHAAKFSHLLTQDVQGRIKPVDTLTMEIMNKVHRGYSYKGMNANQVVLGMLTAPQVWQEEKLIRVSNPGVNELLGVNPKEKYLAFSDFFSKDGQMRYLLREKLEEVNRKRPIDRDKLDKELLKVDERANVCFMVYNGDVFKIFPSPEGTKNDKWFAPVEAMQQFSKENGTVIQQLTMNYLQSVGEGITGGDWAKADEALAKISGYQNAHGAALFPAPSIIQAELVFNEFNIFERLAPVYGIIGFILLTVLFISIVKNHPLMKLPVVILFYLLVIAFLGHTMGLGLRWYVSGHAPWSNGYESLIYISWATMLAGLFFSKKSSMTLAATSILAALTLFVAHLSWMDPQITNLVPVLKSYWLTIHVSIISASYGFLALGALLGFITMLLFILRSDKRPNIDHSITELTKINEMTIIIGLAMITIGNMLGAVWANESWGRYWSWDAKETWTLVSIMVYAFIVHTRFIPKMKTAYFNAVASTVAFASIIMTYFGVNYYLSGMHSYAAGDPVPVPDFVYYTIITVVGVVVLAARKRDSILPLQK